MKRALSVPFVDYARGDGRVVGPGGDVEWSPIVIGDEDGWVDRYRGLWGLDTGDRFAGERAPAGPKYTRTGSVRQSWHDPLGFAGLDKVAPPSQAIPVLETRIAELTAARQGVDGRGRRAGRLAARAGRRGRGRPGDGGAGWLPRRPGDRAAGRARSGWRSFASRRSSSARRSPPAMNGWPPSVPAGSTIHDCTFITPRSPNRRRSLISERLPRRGPRVSVGLLIVALAIVVWFRILPPPLAIVVLLGSYLAIESFFDRNVMELVLKITVVLALLSTLVLAVEYLRELLLVGLLGLGIILVFDSLGEVRRRLLR